MTAIMTIELANGAQALRSKGALNVPVQGKYERPNDEGKRDRPSRKIRIEPRCRRVAFAPMGHLSLPALQQNNPAVSFYSRDDSLP
jgi:hypothetical protein